MKTKWIKSLRFLMFFGVGVGILWWLYRDQDWNQLLNAIKKDVHFGWIFLSLLIGLLSHVSRTVRWQMLVEPMGKRPAFINTFLAVMIGYLANLAIPRMGEVSRCAVLSRHEKISFTGLVGTVVAERMLDVVSLLLSLLLVVIFQFGMISAFVTNTMDLSRFKQSFATPTPYVIFFFIGASIWLFRRKLKTSKIFYKVQGLWTRFKEGFMSFRKVKHPGWFIFHSVTIFLFYFLMMYVCFFAFPYTSQLTPLAGLSVFVFGTLGMVAPVQGGIGPWHFMVITALKSYGIPAPEAGIFALIVHGALNAMIVIAGFLSIIALPFLNKTE